MTDKARRAMAFSVIAHGLRSPTSVIGGYARMLREGRLTGEAFDRALTGMASAAEELGSLANQVADLANWSGTAGRVGSPHTVPQLLAQAVADCTDPARVQLDPVEESGPSPSPDSSSLRTALVTLVDVALGQLEPAEVLAVALRQGADHGWTIEMRPSGHTGLRGEESTDDAGGVWRAGGVALFIAVAILEAHGGTVLSLSDGRRGMVLRLASQPEEGRTTN